MNIVSLNKRLLSLLVTTVIASSGVAYASGTAAPAPTSAAAVEFSDEPAAPATAEDHEKAILEQQRAMENGGSLSAAPGLVGNDAAQPTAAPGEVAIPAPGTVDASAIPPLPTLPPLPGTAEPAAPAAPATNDNFYPDNHGDNSPDGNVGIMDAEGEPTKAADVQREAELREAIAREQQTPPPVPAPISDNITNDELLNNLFNEDTPVAAPALPELPVVTAEEQARIKKEQEEAEAKKAEEAKKPKKKPQPKLVALPKEYRLSPSVYKKEYSRDNRHLPVAQYERDYDEQLFLAVAADNTNVVRTLLQTGRSTEMRNPEGDTLLTYAVRNGSKNVVRMLLGRNVDVNANGAKGLTALQYAMLSDRMDIANALLEMGADPNAPDVNGNTPLMQAVLTKNHAYTSALINHGAVINIPTLSGRTALHVASENNQTDTLAALIQAGGDVNVADVNGDTPLILAARSGSRESARILLGVGADPYITNNMGKTAADVARDTNNSATLNTILSAIVRHEMETGYSYAPAAGEPVPVDDVPVAAAP
ncbi:MAG: hypothetical protein FJX23_09625, partial [Alphaproteobacteria bacterium]|nr:hypothetical protein [Alphaproteobacteria bacterium]